MTTLNNTDLFLVERDGQNYQITSDQMSTLNDTDLLLVERDGTQYKMEAQDLDLGPTGVLETPVEVLTPLNGAGVGELPPYNPISSPIVTVGAGGFTPYETDPIDSVTTLPAWNQDVVWSGETTNDGRSEYPTIYAFDGNLTLFCAGPNGGSIIFRPSTALSGKLEIYGNDQGGPNIYNQLTVNSAEGNVSAVQIPAQSWYDCGTQTNITEIKLSSGGNGGPTLYGIRLNGQILVDTGVSGQPSGGPVELTFTDDTNLDKFQVGDVVQGAGTADEAAIISIPDPQTDPPTITVDGGTWDTSNQSQVWSKDLDAGTPFNGAVENVFDGNVDTFVQGEISRTVLWQPVPSIQSGAEGVEIKFDTGSGQGVGSVASIFINGAEAYSGAVPSDSYAFKVPGSENKEITSLSIAGANGEAVRLYYVKVAGQLLVDAVNDSQVWSESGVSSGTLTQPIGGANIEITSLPRAFNGDTSTENGLAMSGGTGNVSPYIYTFIEPIPYQESVSFLVQANSGNMGYHYNGSNAGVGSGESWITVATGQGTINSIGVYNSNGQTVGTVWLKAIKVDGALLVDTGTDRGLGDTKLVKQVPFDLALTCSDDTELANMIGPISMTDENGDLVTPVSDTIVSVGTTIITTFPAKEGSNSVSYNDSVAITINATGQRSQTISNVLWIRISDLGSGDFTVTRVSGSNFYIQGYDGADTPAGTPATLVYDGTDPYVIDSSFPYEFARIYAGGAGNIVYDYVYSGSPLTELTLASDQDLAYFQPGDVVQVPGNYYAEGWVTTNSDATLLATDDSNFSNYASNDSWGFYEIDSSYSGPLTVKVASVSSATTFGYFFSNDAITDRVAIKPLWKNSPSYTASSGSQTVTLNDYAGEKYIYICGWLSPEFLPSNFNTTSDAIHFYFISNLVLPLAEIGDEVKIISIDDTVPSITVDGGEWANGDTVTTDTLEASATDVVGVDGNTLQVSGVSGSWRPSPRIKGASIAGTAPSPESIVFTSFNGGTTEVTGTDASLSSRTWTLESGSSPTGPWTTVGVYEDFDASVDQDGATPWTTGKPLLAPDTYYQVKVSYNSLNATSVESLYNTFKTGPS